MRLPKPYYRSRDGAVTLYCGDARELLQKLSDSSIDFVFTDPPYGHTKNGSLQQRWEAVLGWQDGIQVYRDSRHHSRLLANDGAEANPLVRWFFSEASRLLRAGCYCCCCCCCCGGIELDEGYCEMAVRRLKGAKCPSA